MGRTQTLWLLCLTPNHSLCHLGMCVAACLTGSESMHGTRCVARAVWQPRWCRRLTQAWRVLWHLCAAAVSVTQDGAVIQIALKEGRDGLQMVQRQASALCTHARHAGWRQAQQPSADHASTLLTPQLVLYSMYTRTQSIMDLEQPRPRR